VEVDGGVLEVEHALVGGVGVGVLVGDLEGGAVGGRAEADGGAVGDVDLAVGVVFGDVEFVEEEGVGGAQAQGSPGFLAAQGGADVEALGGDVVGG
jgi:hypothetical protein